MKINSLFKNILLAMLINLSIPCKIKSQATIANNTAGGINFLGWANNVGVPLTIQHQAAQPIQFYTNAGTGATINNMRMRILGNYAGQGLIGIGDMGTGAAPFAPANQLHQHRLGNTTLYHQFTNNNTGVTAADGSLFGIEYRAATNPAVNYSLATIRQKENAPIYFYTTDSLRMVINENRSNMIYAS